VQGRGGRELAVAEDQQDSESQPPAGATSEPTDAVTAEAVVVAVPHMRAASLLEPLVADLGRVRALGSSPIVNLHVVYDRRVCDEPFAAGVGTPVQYLFDRSEAAGAPAGSQYLAVSLSGAEREMGMSVEALRELYLPAMVQLLPRAREAKVECFVATREHAATFLAAPGVGRLRPGAQTPIAGLVLAGAWTATGWPATLEGAVLSGHSAAAEALRTLEAGPAAHLRPRAVQAGTPSVAGGGERR
jgi:monoamine oxidase